MKTRDDVYYLLMRKLAWLDPLLTAEQKTELDGAMWDAAAELTNNPNNIDVPGDPCVHGVPKFIPCSRCFNGEPAS